MRKNALYELFYLCLTGIGDIDRHEVGVAVSVEIVAADRHVHTTRNAQEGDVHRLCGIGYVNDMNAFIDLVQEHEIIEQKDLAGR